MTPEPPPDTITLPLSSIVSLAIEHWRLSAALASLPNEGPAPARHAARKLGDFLRSCHLQASSLDNSPYEPGLAAQVIDTLDDPSLPPGHSIIDETLSPLVTYRGQVIRPAEVTTRRNTATKDSAP